MTVIPEISPSYYTERVFGLQHKVWENNPAMALSMSWRDRIENSGRLRRLELTGHSTKEKGAAQRPPETSIGLSSSLQIVLIIITMWGWEKATRKQQSQQRSDKVGKHIAQEMCAEESKTLALLRRRRTSKDNASEGGPACQKDQEVASKERGKLVSKCQDLPLDKSNSFKNSF